MTRKRKPYKAYTKEFKIEALRLMEESEHRGASMLIGINNNTTKASIIVKHADVNITKNRSLEQSTDCLEEAFQSRDWQIAKLEKAAIECTHRESLYICALVAAVLSSITPTP
jgi:hypothetical protein